MYIHAKIGLKDGDGHIEEFDVKSMETAKEDVQMVIDNFNNTLKPGEHERYVIEILDKVIIATDNEFNKRAYKFYKMVMTKSGRNFDNNWCKANMDKVSDTFHDLHCPGSIKKMQALIRSSPYKEYFEEMLEYVEKDDDA